MAAAQAGGGDFWATEDQLQHGDPTLSTAQILTNFQQTNNKRVQQFAACDDSCKAQPPLNCVEECEQPFTADCTDSCVVVCEAPLDDDGDFCCEPQTVCQSADCQYSSLDHRCCMGCPDMYAFDGKADGSFFDHSSYGQTQTPLAYQYQQHQGVPNYHAGHSSAGPSDGECQWGSHCHASMAYSHCSLPCSTSSYDPYSMTPTSTMTQSSADSPWTLQSPTTSVRGSQSYQNHWYDGGNRLSVLASSVDEDRDAAAISMSRNYSESTGQHHGDLSTISTADMVNLMQEQYGKTPTKNRHSRSARALNGDNSPDGQVASHLYSHEAPMMATDGLSELHCRWLVRRGDALDMCRHHFDSRESLHAHILDEHVKSMKKKLPTSSSPNGADTASTHPICRWNGCESAHKKKVFKLQHLKDHIVCHSKLRMKCSVCGKECRDAKVLKIHMNSHRPGQEKPFRCDFEGCSASFGTSALLSSHKRVHTGEKPHKCTWCDYRAADKGNLRRHEEEMHMGKKWPCPYCSQQLAKKANLTRHIRDLHASEEAKRLAGETTSSALS